MVLRPITGSVMVSGISAGDASAHPLRWLPRQKALLSLPSQVEFDPNFDRDGLLAQIQLDMGQVISAEKRKLYPDEEWRDTYNNKPPELSEKDLIIEFTAHREACFHLFGKNRVPVAWLEEGGRGNGLKPVPSAVQEVRIRVIDKNSGLPVAAKIHLHGQAGEYLAPVDRHRIVNSARFFEDFSVDFIHRGQHSCTYIPGTTSVKLPGGKVFIEVSKGYEVRPIRKVLEIAPQTEEIVIELEKVLPWREKGWVSADTHVHFLSPGSALMEGAGEGVNLVNLLASQWGELMTNVGDFDGRTTFGAKEAGGDGEYLVRVGTENRQHVLGHISLLGYEGQIIAPMCTGGPGESALGDPIEVLLTEWARRCRKQGGVVILPHHPNPRSESAASIVSGDIDAVEMTSGPDLYGGIDPYSLSDWYRYLNCGYFVAAVGGTDKMTPLTPVGAVRTYARIEDGKPFNHETWKEAIREGNTFATYGPLLDFSVDGKPPGARIQMSAAGGSVDVTWNVASCTIPMTKVALVVNGEIKEQQTVHPWKEQGHWPLKVGRSSWLALLVRGQYPDREEMIAAHSSPVMIELERSRFFAAADALTILEQIEGAMAYLDTVGTRKDEATYKRMRLVLESAHRKLHNQMHQKGIFHGHAPPSG
jgi:hypothetical protein